jgi:hypothetical protein
VPDWALCDGLGDEKGNHCCWLDGAVCPHLQVDGPSGRHYACGLYVELGDWAAVHTDARYLADVRPHWTATGTQDCGSWFGPQGETIVAIQGRGEMTEAEFVDHAQCCFKRYWCSTPQRQRQAVRAINRYIGDL